jgi:hypothetical protein
MGYRTYLFASTIDHCSPGLFPDQLLQSSIQRTIAHRDDEAVRQWVLTSLRQI